MAATTSKQVQADSRKGITLEPHQIILRPLVTEKGMHRSTRYNQYAFEVNPLATKIDIRNAVEELFEDVKNPDTPIIVKRIVKDIDEIVRDVRFDGWQNTHAGEREVKKVLRKTLFKYRLHQDVELFDKAYGYIRQYY